ncbi:MAG: DUF883 C-terminal domain-containing protein [Pseudomonadota bacterium]|nr:DUF883 C-terminal domain-containing protein [Pseudomonadota bacterium]
MARVQNESENAGTRGHGNGSETYKSLKDSGVALGQHVKEDAREIARSAMNGAMEKMQDLRSFMGRTGEYLEKEVRARPLQSLGIAVAAGAVLSFLLRRR